MRQEQQKKFISHDGEALFYRHWPALNETTMAQKPSPQTPAIILFHRGHEHSGRIAHLVDELNLPDYQFFAWDARGNGQSPGERGDAPSFACLVRDAEYFFQHIKRDYQLTSDNIAVIGQSVGAVIAATWVHDYVPNIRTLILGSPAFRVKLYVPFAITGLKLLYNFKGNFFVNSYVKPALLTHDKQRQTSFNNDPLITRAISTRVLLDLYSTAKRLIQDAQSIHTPTMVLVSGSDYVVRRKPQQQFFANLASSKKEYHVLPHFYHDTFGEENRQLAIDKVRGFIVECFSFPQMTPSLLQADKMGYTREESDKLSQPERNVIKKLYWRMTRRSLQQAGAISAGIKLGLATGFDSGSTLDYVYCNQATGETGFGRYLDFLYLQSIGWRGIRQRKAHVKALLKIAIDQLRAKNEAVHIVDIAAGHGRYILETINELNPLPDSVLLRDYSDLNVSEGQRLIEEKGLTERVSFEKGDAFNQAELASLTQSPTLAVVSGLYELFGDNQLVSGSLNGLAESMAEGSYLVYTGQPWHPQLEFIARALTSHREGKPWVMRRRTQLEMDQLVAAAGFKKVDMLIDEWGIFTVSLAQRVNS